MSDINKKIIINISTQQLELYCDQQLVSRYTVSTALNGPGQQAHSGKTPLGLHKIRLKIGHDCPSGTVFVGRRTTGEIYSDQLAKDNPDRDWILTRIIWLSGCESGFNRGGQVDTLRRYIYIHGCPDSEPVGTALSHGCIRMRNSDLLNLFEQVELNMPVKIRL